MLVFRSSANLLGVLRSAILPSVLLTLVGCHHAVAPALKRLPSPSVAGTGWTEAKDAESGISLDLPPGWRVGVPRVLDASSLMNGGADLSGVAGPASESGTELMRQDAAREKADLARMREKDDIVLHCVDGSKPTPAEEPTRIYVKRFVDAGVATLDEAVVKEEQDEHREAKVTVVDLPVGKAARLIAQGQNRIGDVECHVSYVFLDGPTMVALRFASTNNPDAILSVEKGVAQTFRVAASNK